MNEWYLPPIKGNKIGLVTDTFCLDSRIGAIGSALLTTCSCAGIDVVTQQTLCLDYLC